MRVDVVGLKFEVTDAIREYADSKVEKLSRYFDGIQLITIRLAQPAGRDFEVELVVVHASNAFDAVDPKLRPVMQHLRFVKFKGFKQLSKQDASLGRGQKHTYNVAGGRKVEVQLLGRDAKAAKIRVQVFDPNGSKTLDSTLSVHRNKTFMVAGPRYDGGVLIFPLTARY